MAAPFKSELEKQLSGAYDKNPQRKRALRVGVEGKLGQPPAAFLNKHSPTAASHREAWKDIKSAANAAGVQLTSADRLDAEMLARVMVRCRRPEPQSSDFSTYDKLSTKLRLGNAGRSLKAVVEKAAEKPENDEWSNLTMPPARPATHLQ